MGPHKLARQSGHESETTWWGPHWGAAAMGPHKLARQSGHESETTGVPTNDWSMHLKWKPCLHWNSWRSFSPGSTSHKHIVHCNPAARSDSSASLTPPSSSRSCIVHSTGLGPPKPTRRRSGVYAMYSTIAMIEIMYMTVNATIATEAPTDATSLWHVVQSSHDPVTIL